MTDVPPGRRFSHLHIPRGEPTSDSARMRRRIASALWALKEDSLSTFLESELGISIPYAAYVGANWTEFADQADLRDILDTVTLVYRRLQAIDKYAATKRDALWLNFLRRIFKEENVRYLVDDAGGVHFSIDQEFEQNRATAIAAMQSSRYRAVAATFDEAISDLDATPPDGRFAIRATFAAAEGLFRLTFPKANLLGADELSKYLRPAVDQLLAGDEVARAAANKLITSFREWVIAAHNYRHEPGTEEPNQPPVGIAILMVSQGAGFIRWLAEIDQALSEAPATVPRRIGRNT